MKNTVYRVWLLCFLLIQLTCAAAHAQIDVQSTMFDGKQITAQIHIVPAEEPAYIVLDSLTIGGVPFDAAGSDASDMWLGYPSSSQSDHPIRELLVLLEEGYVSPSVEDPSAAFARLNQQLEQAGSADVSFRLTLLAPDQSIAEVDISFTGDSTNTWQLIDDISARGDTPVDAEQPYTVLVSSDCWDGIHADEPVGYPLGSVDALVNYANMEIVEQQTLSFSISAP